MFLLAGYGRTLIGGGFPYHGPQPDVGTALLMRSQTADARIAWETESPPPGRIQDPVRFLMLGAIQVSARDPRSWTLWLDGHEALTVTSPTRTVTDDIVWSGGDGVELALRHVQVDRFQDLMGHLVLTVPADRIRCGRPLRIDVTGESADSATWFMVYEYTARDHVTVRGEPAVLRHPDGPRQVVRLEIVRYAPPAGCEVTLGAHHFHLDLDPGHNVRDVAVPEVTAETTLAVTVAMTDGARFGDEVLLRPVRRRTVHLLHHSHVDIGYTHRQDEVERRQWRHLETAIDLARRTRDLPEAARFRWCTEVAWAVDSYLAMGTEAQREALADAIRNGAIEVGALFANELSALCSPQELLELTAASRRIEKTCGTKNTTAMITDIPGWTWSLVPALARAGVRHLSLGLNRGHRIGSMLETWADRPFWWESASGEQRLLCWIHGEGYSLFHTHMYAEAITNRLVEDTVFPALRRLERAGFSHAACALRYSVGADNGPPHEILPDTVNDWNARYETPRLVISTVTRAFSALEDEAGRDLPVVRGDLTAYWEDGAASTARELALNRASASRLTQAEVMWSLIDPDSLPAGEFEEAWRQTLLFDEHTWGSWNSISEPDADLTRQQWAAKQAMALSAHVRSRKLLNDALDRRTARPEALAAALEVVNTEAWPRTDLVTVPAAGWTGARLTDDNGRRVPVQVLASGELAFVARDIPPLGSRIYHILWGETASSETSDGSVNVLSNNDLEIFVDEIDGSLRRCWWKSGDRDLVDGAAMPGLAGYLHVAGRDPVAAAGATGARTTTLDEGPVVTSLRVEVKAPGCRAFVREFRLVRGLDRLEILTTLDREQVRTPEAVHLTFPFLISDPVVRYDLAWDLCRAEQDQAPGGNRNHLTVATYADVSGPGFGVTLACPDAPLIEIGAIRADPTVTGWTERLEQSATLYAYIMNNYWETNYRAEQPGPVTLRHIVTPHGPFDPVAARRCGLAARRPLHVIPVPADCEPLRAPVRPEGEGLEILRLRPAGDGRWLLILNNAAETPVTVGWTTPPVAVQECDFDGDDTRPMAGAPVVPAHGLVSLLVRPARPISDRGT